MNLTVEHIRKACVFLLLFTLNLRFLFSGVVDQIPILLPLLCIIFALASIDYTAISKSYLIITGFVLINSIFNYSYQTLNTLIILLLMQSAYYISIKTYLKYTVIILGVSAIVMLLLYGTGRMESWELADSFSIRTRHNFNMGHPNLASLFYYGLLISSILLMSISKYKRYLPAFLIVTAIAAYYLYSLTNSRNFLMSTLVFYIVIGYYSIRKYISKDYRINYSRYFFYILPFLFTVIIIYIGLNAESLPLLDIAMSGRPSLYNEFFQTLTFSNFILGSTAFEDIIVDNAYIQLLFYVGVILYIFFIWIYIKAIKNILKQQNFTILAYIASALTYGAAESTFSFLIIIGNNLLWVLLYKYSFGEDKIFDIDDKVEINSAS